MSTKRPGGVPRNAHTDWPFPFPAPGRPKPGNGVPPPRSAYRWPYRPSEDEPLPGRGVTSSVSLREFKRGVTRNNFV